MMQAKYRVVSIIKDHGLINLSLYEQIPGPMMSAAGSSRRTTPSEELTPILQTEHGQVEGPEIVEDPKAEGKALSKTMPVPETEEEKIIAKLFAAVKKYMPGFDPTQPGMGMQPTFHLIPIRAASTMNLRITPKQYEDLGSPQFNQIITFRLENQEFEARPHPPIEEDAQPPIEGDLYSACPKCNSPDTKPYIGFGDDMRYICKNCNNKFSPALFKKNKEEREEENEREPGD